MPSTGKNVQKLSNQMTPLDDTFKYLQSKFFAKLGVNIKRDKNVTFYLGIDPITSHLRVTRVRDHIGPHGQCFAQTHKLRPHDPSTMKCDKSHFGERVLLTLLFNR